MIESTRAKRLLVLGLSALLPLAAGACARPVISDISDSSVTVQHPGASTHPEVLAKAAEGCALYGRKAQPLSYRCGDGYCVQKLHLFACMNPATAPQAVPETRRAAEPSGLVDCTMHNGATVPTTAMGCLQSGGRLADAARVASPAPPTPPPEPPLAPPAVGAPDPAPRVTTALAGPRPPEGTSPAPAPVGADACAPYAPGTIDRVRCGWVTGPERESYVPVVGRSAGLKAQMDCIPVRDDEAQYRSCLARAY